jgi:hypothetical protein
MYVYFSDWKNIFILQNLRLFQIKKPLFFYYKSLRPFSGDEILSREEEEIPMKNLEK